MGCSTEICSTVVPYYSTWLQGTACCTIVFSIGCRGISVLTHRTPPLLPSSLALDVCRIVFLTFFYHSSLSQPLQWFLPFLKRAFTEAQPNSLMGSAVSWDRFTGVSWNCILPKMGAVPGPFSQMLPMHCPFTTETLLHRPSTLLVL